MMIAKVSLHCIVSFRLLHYHISQHTEQINMITNRINMIKAENLSYPSTEQTVSKTN